jgi:hypothetical protein
METNFVKKAIADGGRIRPLIIPASDSNGLGLMNPSIIIDGDEILVVLRNVNYTFYHSEKKLFHHPYGPLTYLHPEDDLHLRTTNWLLRLNHKLEVTSHTKIDTSRFDTYEPMWDFVGLEDARIVKWNGKFFITGVRRDTTTNGQGRMELSEIEITAESVVEVARYRIEPPNDPDSYCEKNWMPVMDQPFKYVKWSNPTELVEVYTDTLKSKTLHLSTQVYCPRDIRGGSQVIKYDDGYFALTHEVDLFKSPEGRKDSVYYHRFIFWDKDFNIKHITEDFHFMDAHVEFCIGMVEYGDSYLMTFGFQDNAAFILECPRKTIEAFSKK